MADLQAIENYTELERKVHGLKGAAGTLGGMRTYDAAADCCEELRSEAPNPETQIDRVLKELADMLVFAHRVCAHDWKI